MQTVNDGVTGYCKLCDGGGRLVKHHYSYNPEKTILVCNNCHERIHKGDLRRLDPTVNGNRAIKWTEGVESGWYELSEIIQEPPKPPGKRKSNNDE